MTDETDRLTGRERILHAAIDRFARHGTAGASLKVIAEDAGVSQALIVHHFGSKERLREACDDHILTMFRDQLARVAEEGAQLDVLAAFRRRQQEQASVLPYLARSIAEGSPATAALVDELAEEVVRQMELGVANGTYVPTAHPRERALVLLMWSLGAVVMHEHVQRLLGADLAGEPADLLPYLHGATPLLTDGLFSEQLRDGVHAAIAHLEQERAP